MASLGAKLEDTRKKLVRGDARSRLIHVNRKAKRVNAVNIFHERADDVFRLLNDQSKHMRFEPKGKEEKEEELSGGVLFEPEEKEEQIDESRYTDLLLETPLTFDALQKRLLRISREAKIAEEEQGINILFLAIGFLRWYEARASSTLKESPLILLPVELVRGKKSSSSFEVKCREDDIAANLPLQGRLQDEFGIRLPEIDDSEGWSPSSYYAKVQDAIAGQPGWEIDANGMQLGFFSFAKLTMFDDLDPKNWSKESILENKLVRGLLEDGFEPEPSRFSQDTDLDQELAPGDVFQVVDADASQTKVIEEVRSGRNLVVQGPPGTGKSQTIANILAAAAHDGKTALFVAEKMAALEVVYHRMNKVGLHDLCLELHSQKANKRQFYEEIKRTIDRGRGAQPVQQNADSVKDARDKLNVSTNTLHHALEGRDYSPYFVLTELIGFIGKGLDTPHLDASALEAISEEKEHQVCEDIEKYVNEVERNGFEEKHLFKGAAQLNLQPTDQQRLLRDLRDALREIEQWGQLQVKLASMLKLEAPGTLERAEALKNMATQLQSPPVNCAAALDAAHANAENARFHEALEIAKTWASAKKEIDEIAHDSVWNQGLENLRPPMVKGVNSRFSRIFGKYRSAGADLASHLRDKLPKKPEERLSLLDAVLDAQSKKRAADEEEAFLKEALGGEWRGVRTDFASIRSVVDWLNAADKALLNLSAAAIREQLENQDLQGFDPADIDRKKASLLESVKTVVERLELPGLSEEELNVIPLSELEGRFAAMEQNPGKYDAWVQYCLGRKRLVDHGLEQLLNLIEDGAVELDAAVNEFRYALNETRWKYAMESLPELAALKEADRHRLVNEFKHYEEDRFAEVQELIRTNHLAQIPQGSAGQMGVIRSECAKKRSHRPIRRLMQGAAEVIQRIKPIFLMSPISVAKFLPSGAVKFDLLVIDEASQVRPEDALGAIARASQIVVVGDQKQLPPTSFFDRLTDNQPPDDDDDDPDDLQAAQMTEMESVLSLCEAKSLNQSMLEWHYRSRDPSLITVSNIEFYDRRLILPPCPTEADDGFGLKFRRVPGAYTSASRGTGRRGTNHIEAEKICERLAELARERPEFSVGIVTFSKTQADMVNEVLYDMRRKDKVLDDFLHENKSENVFVKSIENVQGDERDIILISVGYGPFEPNQRLTRMSFGPVNSDGGERRLNVLFTRSRISCEVFASFDPGDIDLSKVTKQGPKVLKKFLEFARSGVLEEFQASDGEPDSPFEEDVAAEIQKLGFQAEHQVGTSGFRIDLGVRDPENPGRHILAVECDGAAYHSSLSARERDRQRQTVLENLGWRFHRIWSTDWFYHKDREIQRLKDALDEARNRNLLDSIQGANRDAFAKPEEEEKNSADLESSQAATSHLAASEYEKAQNGDLLDAARSANGDSYTAPAEQADMSDMDSSPAEIGRLTVPKYKKAEITLESFYPPYEQPPSEVIKMATQIVEIEGPVHVDQIARRYADAHGEQLSARIREVVLKAMEKTAEQGPIVQRGKFWGTNEQFENALIRDRGDEDSHVSWPPEHIPEEEIRACARWVERENGHMETDELAREMARIFGFKRTGKSFKARVREVLQEEAGHPEQTSEQSYDHPISR